MKKSFTIHLDRLFKRLPAQSHLRLLEVSYNYFSGLFYSTAGSEQKSRALAAGIHEATLAVGMSVGTIVGGVLGTLVNQRLPYLLAAAVLLVLVVVQSVAWWRWVRPLHQKPPVAVAEPCGLDCDSNSARLSAIQPPGTQSET